MSKVHNLRVFFSMPDPLLQKLFLRRGYAIAGQRSTADVFVFTGGEDIIPVLYGEKPLRTTQYNLFRDLTEIQLAKSIPRSIPKVGICRGAQLLNVLYGGKLWQHVTGHGQAHAIYMEKDKETIEGITSVHHQMMRPPTHARILGWAAEATTKESEADKEVFHLERGDPMGFVDPEIVWFKDDHALCFQPHPEYGTAHNPTEELFFSLFEDYILNRIQPKKV